MPSIAYILAGQLTIEEQGTVVKATYVAGEAFAESLGSVPVVVVVTYAGSRGSPFLYRQKTHST